MGFYCLMRYILEVINKKSIKFYFVVMIIAVSLPFINATGGRFILYSDDVNLGQEVHVQYNHGFFSAAHFLKHDIIKQSSGVYGIWNDTIFMLPINTGFYHMNNNKKSIDVIKNNALNQLSYTKIVHLNENRTKGKIYSRGKQAVLEYNLLFKGRLGL